MTGPVNDPSELGRHLCAVLDPLMTTHGFLAGQWGMSSTTVGVVFCSLHYSHEGACTDLHVSVERGEAPRMGEVHLEGRGLDVLLRDVGRHDLEPDIAALARLNVEAGVERLRDVLTVIFDRSTRSSTPGERGSDA